MHVCVCIRIDKCIACIYINCTFIHSLRALPSYKVIDFHKVEGLKGAYIASQINSQNKLESFITFDKGGVWQHVVPPSQDANGQLVHCEWVSGSHDAVNVVIL